MSPWFFRFRRSWFTFYTIFNWSVYFWIICIDPCFIARNDVLPIVLISGIMVSQIQKWSKNSPLYIHKNTCNLASIEYNKYFDIKLYIDVKDRESRQKEKIFHDFILSAKLKWKIQVIFRSQYCNKVINIHFFKMQVNLRF